MVWRVGASWGGRAKVARLGAEGSGGKRYRDFLSARHATGSVSSIAATNGAMRRARNPEGGMPLPGSLEFHIDPKHAEYLVMGFGSFFSRLARKKLEILAACTSTCGFRPEPIPRNPRGRTSRLLRAWR